MKGSAAAAARVATLAGTSALVLAIAAFAAPAALGVAGGDESLLSATASVDAQPDPGGGPAQVSGCGSYQDFVGDPAAEDATITLETSPGVTVTSGANPASLGALGDGDPPTCRQWTVDVADSEACQERTLPFTMRVAAPGLEEVTADGLLVADNPCGLPANGKIVFTRSDSEGGSIWSIEPDGSDLTRLTDPGFNANFPSASADGTQIAFHHIDGGNQIYSMNADGSNPCLLVSNGYDPAFSPDGSTIAFTRNITTTFAGTPNDEIFLANADGTSAHRLTFSNPPGFPRAADFGPTFSPDSEQVLFTSFRDGTDGGGIGEIYSTGGGAEEIVSVAARNDGSVDDQPDFSPDGTKIAFTSSDASGFSGIRTMDPDGGSRATLVEGGNFPAYSPDATKIVFNLGNQLFVANADGTEATQLPTGATNDVASFQADWAPLVDDTNASTGNLQVGFASAQGCFEETSPGSEVFETDQKAWVGGFEIVPRPGGKLVLDTENPGLSTSGTGADVVFAGFEVPIPVPAIPVGVQDGSFEIGGPGSVAEMLGIPVESSVEFAWADDGRSATYEQEVKLESLTEGLGELVEPDPAESGEESEGKLKARLVNGKGFILESGEFSINEIDVVPKALKVKRRLKLKNLLLKLETREGKPFWTGRAGISLPLSRGALDITGTVFAFDGSLAGGGLEVDGINKRVLGPLFLQKVAGDLLFAPEFGIDLRAGGTIGPVVDDKELVTFDGTLKGGSLVTDCASSGTFPDPMQFQGDAGLSPLESFEQEGLAEVEITIRNCVYPGTDEAAAALEGTLEGSVSFLDVFGYESTQTGFISSVGASYEGDATLTIPALPDLQGSVILSTVGLAACADLAFFEGGFGHIWGGPLPTAFSGCDLGPFRLLQARSASGEILARRAGGNVVEVPAGLPHAGFAAVGTDGAPRVEVTGPGDFSLRSPADGTALQSKHALIVPVAHERTTYVFVDDPKAGRYKVRSLEPGNPVTEVRFAQGLATPKIKAKVAKVKKKGKGKKGGKKPKKGKLQLTYELRKIPGQRVIFSERGDGIARTLGRAKGNGGKITFKPTLGTDRARTIEAAVIQNGLPRETLTVARFAAPLPPG